LTGAGLTGVAVGTFVAGIDGTIGDTPEGTGPGDDNGGGTTPDDVTGDVGLTVEEGGEDTSALAGTATTTEPSKPTTTDTPTVENNRRHRRPITVTPFP
jgi:hypothetical protein